MAMRLLRLAADRMICRPSTVTSISYICAMCRSIHRLRDGTEIDDPSAMEEAARQYVRKVSGFSKPALHNQAAFDRAVAEITDATERLMASLVIGARTGS
jgi:hypothetical protein